MNRFRQLHHCRPWVRKCFLGFGSTILVVGVLLVAIHVWLSVPATAPAPASDSTLRVATYNVHYIINRPGDGRWSLGGWEARKDALAEAVGSLDADIIGFQEMETFGGGSASDTNLTLDWLLQNHPGFTAGAVGDPATFPSTQPIFYRDARFKQLDQGWFFFSETPDTIYSRTYNGSYPAFASWVELSDSDTGAEFKVVNIHTDFASYRNRRRSLELVRDRITPWLEDGTAVLVVGDFNAWLGSRLHATVEEAGLAFASVWPSTYHFDHGWHLFPAVDHVSFSSAFSVSRPPVVVQQKFLGQWPTDHHPVVVDLQWQRK